jgi:hypothetical protein
MKQQIFIDGEYQYDYEKKGENHILSYCDAEFWSVGTRNTEALVIKDDGDKLSIRTAFRIKRNQIDYDEAERLEILFRIINSNPTYEIGTKEPL